MKESIKKLFQISLVLLAIFCLYRFCHKQTGGFSVQKILSHFPNESRWETPRLADREEVVVRRLLEQPYTYLGKGAQCYVFASEDGQAVIKFFKVSHLEAPRWLTALPLPSFLKAWRSVKIAFKENKRQKDFSSYLFAYDQLKEETGLLYLHLNKSTHLQQKITIIDKIGIAHKLDLDGLSFILQKKADLFYPALEEMIAHKEIDRAKSALKELVHLFQKRRSLGLADKDPDLKTNFGMIEGIPVQFDIGRFQKGDLKNESFEHELIRITDECKKWLKTKEPALADYLENEIKAAGQDV